MVDTTTGIGVLPNEILITILSSFRTRQLLPMTPTSHRFHDLILRILHHRLLVAAALKDHKLIFECFHPSTKISTPYLFCDYLGTDGLSSTREGEGSLYEHVSQTGRLGVLSGLYSHFRPLKPDHDRTVLRLHPAGGGWLPPLTSNSMAAEHGDFVSQNIHLESHELFSQLMTITSLVKEGPKRGLFLSCVNIGEDTLRVWRDWLAKRAGWNTENSTQGEEEEFKNRLLFADTAKHVGLRMRVKERTDGAGPVLLLRNEDAPVSYVLEYEELVIRTTQLLLMVEQSLDQEVNHSGKAIVIGSWDT